jgi:hypothetical protein
MKEKGLTKYIVYSPHEYLKIDGVKSKFENWKIPMAFSGFIVFTLVILITGSFHLSMFGIFVIIFFFNLFFNRIPFFNPNYIEFSQRKVTVRNSRENEEQEQSFYLQSPTYLDIVIKPRKELLEIRFEQFGKSIGTTVLPPDELPYLLDSLSDLLALEIHDSRSMSKREDVLYLRPIGSEEDLLPSYLKITENQLRLIINPVETSQNFIINYQRKILKTAAGNIYPTDDIHTINLIFDGSKITIKGLKTSNSKPFVIINFLTKGYDDNIVKKDLQLFADFLESKPILSHVTFQVLI